MKTRLLQTLIISAISVSLCQTQKSTVAEDFKPSTFNQPGQEYPNAVSYVSDKTGHEFRTWRRSLLAMAPLLFK